MDMIGALKERIKLLEWLIKSKRNFYITFSQCGEDMCLRNIFFHQKHGTYIDIGAHHPFKYSNTFILHDKGWRGINIDAMPGSMKLFNKYRPEDINLEMGMGNTNGEMEFYIFKDGAYNTFDVGIGEQRIQMGIPFVGKKSVKVMRMDDMLDSYLSGNDIDLLTLDVEGMELPILQSNNWQKYKPRYILCEMEASNVTKLLDSPITSFLSEVGGYEIVAWFTPTVVFKRGE